MAYYKLTDPNGKETIFESKSKGAVLNTIKTQYKVEVLKTNEVIDAVKKDIEIIKI